MTNLSKVRVGFSALTGQVYLYRHGKDPGLALDKREALEEVMVAAAQHMLHGITPCAVGAISDVLLTDLDGKEIKAVILVMPKDAFERKFGHAMAPDVTKGEP